MAQGLIKSLPCFEHVLELYNNRLVLHYPARFRFLRKSETIYASELSAVEVITKTESSMLPVCAFLFSFKDPEKSALRLDVSYKLKDEAQAMKRIIDTVISGDISPPKVA